MRQKIGMLLAVMMLMGSVWQVRADDQALNVNTATAKELAKQIKGLGKKKSASIVTYRMEHGAFESLDDLVKVSGVGKKLLLKIRGQLTVEGAKHHHDSVKHKQE